MKRKPYKYTPKGLAGLRRNAYKTHRLLTRPMLQRAGRKGGKAYVENRSYAALRNRCFWMIHCHWDLNRNRYRAKCQFCRRRRR